MHEPAALQDYKPGFGLAAWLGPAFDAGEIPFDFAQGRLSLRLKNGYARDDILERDHVRGNEAK
jgi:hypothetical protein